MTISSQPRYLLEQILENALDAFIVINASSTVTAWTRRAEELLGWSSDEAIGQAISTLIIPSTLRQAHADGMKRYLETGDSVILHKRVEVPAQHKNGHIFPIELSITRIEIDGVPLFSAALRDITERKKLEHQFRATFEQAAVGIAHIAPDGEILQVNQKLCAILGYPAEELLKLNPEAFTHPDDVHIDAPHQQLLLTGKATSQTYEKRYIRKSGDTIWVKMTVSLSQETLVTAKYFISVVEDITESKKVQERAELLAAIIDATPDFVGISNLNGETQYINPAGRKMVGVPLKEDLHSTPISHKYPPWALDVVRKGLQIALNEGTWRGETAVYSANRTEIPTSQVIIVHKNSDGQLTNMSTIIRDMTERYETERKLRDADRRKDEFLAMLAHELRNPLAPISTAAEILKLGGLAPSRLLGTSEIITRQVEHMTDLIDDLLDVSRVTRGLISIDKEPVDAHGIVADAIEQTRGIIERRHHRLDIRQIPGQIRIAGDRTRLVQVLANLLNNAAKYTPDGGYIVIKVAADETDVVFAIQDNGTGISPELLPHVFDLFVQARRTPDRAQGGLGLGLPLVKRLVELHGGEVLARSEGVGKGSEFIVRLPRLHDGITSEEKEAGPTSDNRRQAGKLMVVDDNRDAAQTLAILLEAHGHEVVTEYSAHKALDCAMSLRPDVILLDIGLPDMDGYELARRIRALPELSSTVLIAVTGYGQIEDIERSLQAGFNHHMTKPVDIKKIVSLIQSMNA